MALLVGLVAWVGSLGVCATNIYSVSDIGTLSLLI